MNSSESGFSYGEALKYIHSVNWCFCKPGLERIRELCGLLGDPQRSLRYVHVVGTNGKGSFCSMLESVLRESGLVTGMFTSPYVRTFNERMACNGEPITDGELAEITYYVKQFADKMSDRPTEFELITAIGFEYFKRKKCDIVVLEAGMGGRLDSTNIIEAPLLSVVTGVALDHTAYLGDTVEKIAAEKAGVIKPGSAVLFGGERGDAEEVVCKRAETLGCPYRATDRSAVAVTEATLEGTRFDYKDAKGLYIGLLGLYQPLNAANVVEAVGILRERGIAISDKALREGLATAVWHARFEILSSSPLIIFDGGHNPEGVDAAVRTVRHYFGDERVRVLTGVMADKAYGEMADMISGVACEVFTVKPDNPRALDAETLAEEYRSRGVPSKAFASVREAVGAVFAASGKEISTVALGSLYMYRELADAVDDAKASL